MGSGFSRCPRSVEKMMKPYIHSKSLYIKCMKLLNDEVVKGLDPHSKSTLKMIFTYVHHLPDGTVTVTVNWNNTSWDSAKVVNFNLVEDPAIRQPGFDLPRAQWVMLNRFCTQQGPCRATLKEWGRSNTDLCNCGDLHTMSHIVDVCSLTRFHAGLPEEGDFLAVDLGGTNFRVLTINLDKQKVSMQSKIYPISEEIMTGPGEKLFDHIAHCIEDLIVEKDLIGQVMPLGFTFSFPCKQTSLTAGHLIHWTKGFNCDGVVGQDVVKLLQEAIDRNTKLKGQIECVALLNDTVGCLMSCAFHDNSTRIGVIIGTGTNACYLEKMENVHYFDKKKAEAYHHEVIINTEWGAFGDDGCLDFIRTQLDRDMDSLSINPGHQIYEKMISGMYMGELVRRILLRCVELNLMMGGQKTKQLETPGAFQTKHVSDIESEDILNNCPNAREVLLILGYPKPDIKDCCKLHYICEVISTRAANLVAAGIAVLVNRSSETKITVAVDGSLYRFHPHFKRKMIEMTNKLKDPHKQVEMMLSEDGSGKGAALVAAVAYRHLIASRDSARIQKSAGDKA